MIVIGGGISGLYVAWKMKASMLLESTPRVGGRVRTMRNGEAVDYEGGPWRIHESHRRALRLLHRLGLEVEQTTSSRMRGGSLSAYGKHLIKYGVSKANQMELESGYEGFDAAAAENHAYTRHAGGKYYVVRTGFDSLVEALEKKVKCPIRTNTRVTNVRRSKGQYEIEVSVRKGTHFHKKMYRCKRVVFALPPHNTTQWDVCQQWLRAQINAVKTLPLHHIYGSIGTALPPTHTKDSTSLLAQIVSGDHDTRTFQVSYSGGRRAQFWNRLNMENPRQFHSLLRKELRKQLPPKLRKKRLRRVRSHHFEHAVHYWVPAYGFKGNKRSARQSVVPHPNKLPGLYWVGEAFSSVQGWIEGALETAELACIAMRKPLKRWRTTLRKGEVMVEGRVVNVDTFANVHPGTRLAIQKYMGKDATKVFSHIHPSYSWGIVFALQRRH
tara:strand:+ start:181 stop:1500 length:1320 start_codon:yes stop_codon:yes gene_type:complete